MKNILLTAIIVSSIVACKSSKVNTANAAKKENTDFQVLEGTWELSYISGPRIAFEGLYPEKKPVITFAVSDSSIYGNTGCNNFRGKVNVNSASIHFPDNMAMTRMMCPGEGETVFLNTLRKINKYSVQGSTLTLISDDIAMMRFVKK
ncbi:MAG: META domain-containing protein [Bacteroidetes bacterium]|nr:META domain-containing protein [Bacteroidota bacterium]